MPENWGSGQAEVVEGPRKVTQEMEVLILDRLQRRQRRPQDTHRQRPEQGWAARRRDRVPAPAAPAHGPALPQLSTRGRAEAGGARAAGGRAGGGGAPAHWAVCVPGEARPLRLPVAASAVSYGAARDIRYHTAMATKPHSSA